MTSNEPPETRSPTGRRTIAVRTLAIDIGGTSLKASVLDDRGSMIVDKVWIKTPYPNTPTTMLRALQSLIEPLPNFDRITVGFPGVVRNGYVLTAPHFDARAWSGYDFAHALAEAFNRPVRLLNDAEVQGLPIIRQSGLEVVLTLGTGVGTAVFASGALAPHLELAHHPIRGRMTYNDYVGDAARQRISKRKWNKRVWRMIGIVETLLCFDRLYIGGGNAIHIMLKLPHNVSIVANDNGIIGGVRVWDDEVWLSVKRLYSRRPAR